MTTPALYSRHRQWALSLAAKHDNSDEGRLTALVALWKCCRAYEGGAFKQNAAPEIVAALQREAA